jgi:hypothetical protein
MKTCEMCSIDGANDACRDCGVEARARKAVEMMADVSLFGRDGGADARDVLTAGHVRVAHGVWSVPIVPISNVSNALQPNTQIASVFAARNNVGRHASLFNFLTPALPFWQFVSQFLNAGRLPPPYHFDCLRKADFIITTQGTTCVAGDTAGTRLLCDVPRSFCDSDPILGILQDTSHKGGDVSF